MKAVRIREHGDLDALQIEDIPIPEPKPDEIRVAIKAIALNHLDTWVRRGVPGHKFPLPITPGCDGAGEIDAVGSAVNHLKPGQRVLLSPGEGCGNCLACNSDKENLCKRYGILGETTDGTCAEFVVVKASRAIPIPDSLSFENAAAFPLVFLTAWHMVVERAEIQPGQSILIHAAGSGVSSAAIQIAKLWGATVIATAGNAEKCEKAKDIGADYSIPYLEKDFVKEVKEIVGKNGVDVIIDHVGAATMEKGIRILSKGGTLVTCGTTSGPEITLDFRHVFFKTLAIMGSTMGGRGELHRILDHIVAGRLSPVIDSVYPLEKVQEAHARMQDRAVFGKILLTP